MNAKTLLASAVVLLLTWQPLSAADDPQAVDKTNPHVWAPRTKSVAVFKNGFGFFMREGEAHPRDGWAVAKNIPPAAFGTLAIYSLKQQELVDVVGSGPGEVVEFDGVDAPADSKSKLARLRGAKELNVELSYRYRGENRQAAGKLVSIGEEFVVLEASSTSFAVPVESIRKMQVLELPLRIHVATDADEPIDETQLGMAYLREGITWIPEYSLKVLDETTAELTLRGTLVNEAEDLVHCDVNFVVGVPHFTHTQFLAPIAVGQVIRAIGAAVAPKEVQTQIMNRAAIANNALTSNQFDQQVGERAVDDKGAGDRLKGALGNLPQLDGPGSSDYTVYTRKDLTVRRGERAIVTLFVQKISYSHIYRWSPPSLMEHSLVLQNSTGTAWTTGPCLAVSADRPLSEDLIRYTPQGGKAEIPVAAAINIAHEKSEVEADRKFKAHTPADNVHLDLVSLDGKLQLKNFEPTEVEIVVVAMVPGKPVAASDDGQLAADSTKLQLLERGGTIRWVVHLKPKDSKTLTYRYERYVPSR